MAESIKPETNIEPATPVEAVIGEAVKTVAGPDQTAPAYAVLAEVIREVHEHQPDTSLLPVVDAMEASVDVDVFNARLLKHDMLLLLRRRRLPISHGLYRRILAAPLPVGEDNYDDHGHGHRYDDD